MQLNVSLPRRHQQRGMGCCGAAFPSMFSFFFFSSFFPPLLSLQFLSYQSIGITTLMLMKYTQFMENWCYDKKTLYGFAKHYLTDEPLPGVLSGSISCSNVHVCVSVYECMYLSVCIHRYYFEYICACSCCVRIICQHDCVE